MCGIVGAISTAPIDPKLVEAMRDRLVHRGPDHGGLWQSADSRVCLGHRRLAIIDLTAEANQPFVSHDGRFVITFNGEIYNFQTLREELRALGAPFRTRSDTEVLVEAFRYWDHGCVERLSGMFAFAIWDCVEQRLFCARDRVGEKPFYYAIARDSFILASELKALLLWPGFSKTIDYPALVDYLSFGFVADPKTIWEGSRKLAPGHWMSVELAPDGIPVVKEPVAYWDMEFHPDHSISDWGPEILETLQRAAREMAFADVEVGAFLSGGVDSSSVTAALSKAGCSVNTFTVGFLEQDYDERPWAREVAKIYGTSHRENVVLPTDVSAVFQKLLWHYDEPFNDYSYFPTFYLCREAREVITVALSGDGGDEMFAGYRKYQRLGLRQCIENTILPAVPQFLAKAAKVLLPKRTGFSRRVEPYAMDVAAMMVAMLTTGFSYDSLRRAARGPLAEALKHYAPADTIYTLLQKAPPPEVGLVNSMRYLDLKLTLAGDILVKVDRASMAVSLEVRPIYLHHEIVSLAARIPPALLSDASQSKKALKSALSTWLPDSILHRKKMGFAMPLKRWLNHELQHLFAQPCRGNPLEDLLDAALLEKLTHTHSSGRVDLTAVIHSLFFLKHWVAQWDRA